MRNKNLQHAVSLVHAVDVRSTDLMDKFRYVAEKSNRKDRDGSSTREAISTIKSGRAEINELDQMLTAAEKELTQPNPPSRPKIRLKKPDNNQQFRL
jgi:sugar-specific transcriptional regulator TrmB